MKTELSSSSLSSSVLSIRGSCLSAAMMKMNDIAPGPEMQPVGVWGNLETVLPSAGFLLLMNPEPSGASLRSIASSALLYV